MAYTGNGDSGPCLAVLVAAMGKPTVHTAALQRAASAVGGEARLADTLQVPVAQVQRWLSGEEYPPTAMYQKALDLLIGIGAR